MKRFSAEELALATGGTLLSHPPTDATFTLGTDSRTLGAGQCFVPLSGPNFDGHDFLTQVLERPETGVMGTRARLETLATTLTTQRLVLAVADPLQALGDVASYRRALLQIPIVGLTGTAGKTSTKDLLRGILEQTGPGLATAGNLNNLIGLPTMVLRIADSDRWAVLEMGMNAFGEIARMAQICRPTVRLITNVGSAHTEGVGGIEGVARAKGELFASAQAGDTLVINADDAHIVALPVPDGVRRVTYGTADGVDVQLKDVEVLPDGTSRVTIQAYGTSFQAQVFQAHVPLLGRHNAFNATAAAAAALAVGAPIDAIVQGLAAGKLSPMRMERSSLPGDILVVNDAYNANPSSMEAALDALVGLKTQRQATHPGARAVAVLGDMLELGTLEASAHRTLGEQVASRDIDALFACGVRAKGIAQGALEAGFSGPRVTHALEHSLLADALFSWLKPGDVVLIKGSRGARMEKVQQALNAQFGVQVTENAAH